MVHTLEAIRVGAIGTISALITHELDAIKSTPQMPISYESRPHRQTVPVSIDCGVSTRLSQPRRMSSYKMRRADNMSNALIVEGKGASRRNYTALTILPMAFLCSVQKTFPWIELSEGEELQRKDLVLLKLWTSNVGILRNHGPSLLLINSKSSIFCGFLINLEDSMSGRIIVRLHSLALTDSNMQKVILSRKLLVDEEWWSYEKAPYVAKAMKKKAEYEKAMKEFNSKLNGNGELKPDESGKSSSEVHDENEQEGRVGACCERMNVGTVRGNKFGHIVLVFFFLVVSFTALCFRRAVLQSIMVHTLEAIRVGAIGTISALITHERDAIKSTPQMLKARERPEELHSTRHSPHGIPMLSSEDISMDRTFRRGRTTKKGFGIVEIVDLKCGNTDKSWSRPITDQFEKLSFSRLSD
ncbi:uncharacterized protein LOC114309880 [Camellia sinensis]|uniref:uncharacterized protein LOC114309880 n=1 Tax=Camellia sinensis TaxID=4442 RepID=UPI00103584D1|nr:uncharacterized protein LOC114309880 [Camellia sinensis]